MKTVFILGSGHCGSTLLDLILGSHNNIVGVGEVDNLSNYNLCACGKRAVDCSFWSNLLRSRPDCLKMYKSKKDFALNNGSYFYVDSSGKKIKIKSIKKCFNDHIDFLNKILKHSKSDVIVDSSKNVFRSNFFLDNKEDITIIHLVRDGRAVSWSYMKKYNKFFSYAWKWFAENIKIEILRRRYDVKYLFVRYTDLSRNPGIVVESITNKIGVDFHNDLLSFRNNKQHQIGGNRMKLSGSGKIIEDTEWRDKMPLKFRIIFNIFFGWINLYYKMKN